MKCTKEEFDKNPAKWLSKVDSTDPLEVHDGDEVRMTVTKPRLADHYLEEPIEIGEKTAVAYDEPGHALACVYFARGIGTLDLGKRRFVHRLALNEEPELEELLSIVGDA